MNFLLKKNFVLGKNFFTKFNISNFTMSKKFICSNTKCCKTNINVNLMKKIIEQNKLIIKQNDEILLSVNKMLFDSVDMELIKKYLYKEQHEI